MRAFATLAASPRCEGRSRPAESFCHRQSSAATFSASEDWRWSSYNNFTLEKQRGSHGTASCAVGLWRRASSRLMTCGCLPDARRRKAHGTQDRCRGYQVNGSEIEASVDEQERLMLDIAAARLSRNQLAAWLREHVRSLS